MVALLIVPIGLGVGAIGVAMCALISLPKPPPDTPAFARRASPPVASQLRQDPNARLMRDRGGFAFSRRHWFVGTGCPPARIRAGQMRLIEATQLERPARVIEASGRTWWWFEGRFYWESGSYSEKDVMALVRARERRSKQRLERAHMLLSAEAASQTRREPIPQEVRRAVFERDGGRCTQCGADFDLQYDHVIPVALGGATRVDNLQLLCGECNRAKGADL